MDTGTWRVRGLALFAGATLALGGCQAFGGGAATSPSPTGTSSSSTASPDDSASPFGTASPGGTATPGGLGTPGGDSSPSGSATPGDTGTPATPGSTPGSSGSAAPVSCTSVTPIRIQKVTSDPSRVLEIVTIVSDGRTLTPGTREQQQFAAATLIAPDGSRITDQTTVTTISDLIRGSSGDRVLLSRPDAPDTGIDANRRPYNSPGTYVAYSSTSPLTADVIVQCSGQEQRWQFTAESDVITGLVNCAVEPPRSNAVARQVYSGNC